MHRWRLSFALLLLSLAAAPKASAEKRPLPDYDGRGGAPVTTGDVLLWIPRVLLAPPYFVSEYVIRRPLGAAIAGAERAGWPGALYDFFTFGPNHNAGFVPTLFLDFGFRPSAGVYAFWNDFVPRNDLTMQVGFWGPAWLAASVTDRIHIGCDPADLVTFGVSALRRPDFAFFGLGPSSQQSDVTRYGSLRLEARAAIDKRWWRLSTIHAAFTARQVEFHRGHYGDDVVLDDAIASGAMPAPPGYPEGYTQLKSELGFTFDTREPRPASGSGMRLEVHGSHSANTQNRSGWVGYGGSAGVALDVNGRSRVLQLLGLVHFVDPLGSEPTPFPELAVLGGFGPMRGFFPGRLVGRSAAVAELVYRWPIWIWLDGSMRFEVGNVFGEHMQDFELGLLRMSAAIGVESAQLTDNPLEVLFGMGSETFASGARIDSFRFVLGTHRGF